MVSPIVGPYVSINQLTQFRMGHATTTYSAGPIKAGQTALDLGGRLPSANAGQLATAAQQLAQRTLPGAVEQARQVAKFGAKRIRAAVGG